MIIKKWLNFSFYIFSLVFIANFFISCSTLQTEEEKEITNVIEKLFEAMSEHNSDLARTVLMPESQFYSIREDDSGAIFSKSTHQEFIDKLENSEEKWLERIWEQKMLIHERIAVLWAPYDFYRNHQFSHGGFDAFTLIKTNNGWKITGVIYTVETEGFEKSPLGPPEFEKIK